MDELLRRNRGKLWKWAYLLWRQRPSLSLRTQAHGETRPMMLLAGTEVRCSLTIDPHGLLIEGPEGDTLLPCDHELRTEKVLPLIERQLGPVEIADPSHATEAHRSRVEGLRSMGIWLAAIGRWADVTDDGALAAPGLVVEASGLLRNDHGGVAELVGSRLAELAPRDVALRLSRFAAGEPVAELPDLITASTRQQAADVHFVPGGTAELVLASPDQRPYRWSTEGNAEPSILPLPAGLVAFWPGDEATWLLSQGGSALEWSPESGGTPPLPALHAINGFLALRPSLFAGRGAVVRLRSYGLHLDLAEAPRHARELAMLLPAPRGDGHPVGGVPRVLVGDRWIVVVTASQFVEVFDRSIAGWIRCEAPGGPHDGHPEDGALHPTEPLAVAASRRCVLYDLERRRAFAVVDLPRREEPQRKPRCAFSPEGRYLALLRGGRLFVLRLATWSLHELGSFGASDGPDAIAFSPDGKRLVLSTDRTVALDWERLERTIPRAPTVGSVLPAEA